MKFHPFLLSVLLLSACTVGPDYKKPEFNISDGWFSSSAEEAASEEAIDAQWWNVFEGPMLTNYIEQAAKHNKDLEIAQANILRARAVRREDSGSLFPSIGSNAEANRSGASDNVSSFNGGETRSLFDAGFDASWEIDVFEGGAIRARIDIEKAENKAALAEYEKAVLEALADVESALTRYGHEVETRDKLNDTVQSRQKAVELVNKLLNAGEIDYLAVLDAQRELTASEDDLISSEIQTITKLIALYTALGGAW